jgi:hypothetical protein
MKISNTRLFSIVFLSALLVCIAHITSVAQTNDSTYYKHNKFYYMAGFGFGGGTIGVQGSLNATIHRNGYELTAKLNAQDHVIALTNDAVDLNSEEYALLVGRKVTRHPFSYVVVSTGLAVINIEHRNKGIPISTDKLNWFGGYNYTTENKSTVGIPIEIKYFNNSLSRHVPVTAAFAVNVNSVRSLFSFSLGLQFGNTRERLNKNSNN